MTELPYTLVEAQDKGIAPWTWLQYQDQLSTLRVAVYLDAYPVTDGHLLFVPRVNDLEHILSALELAYKVGTKFRDLGRYEGFNVGMNVGAAAGQTVAWPHVHMIPRCQGDCENPRGGVRGVIPQKQKY